jgi:hypothetical protein
LAKGKATILIFYAIAHRVNGRTAFQGDIIGLRNFLNIEVKIIIFWHNKSPFIPFCPRAESMICDGYEPTYY